VFVDPSDRWLALLAFLLIWQNPFLGMSLAFVVIHGGTAVGARLIL
jgi:hypothetical protein